MAECACCGQTLPDDMPEGLVLRGKRRAIYEAVRRAGSHGIDARRLWALLYGNDPNGGPTYRNIISVHIAHVNHALIPFSQKLWSGPTGNGCHGIYRLVRLNA